MNIRDRVIVITGAASGIGAAAARRFAADGAMVVLTDLNEGPLLELASELGAAALAGDICCEDTVRAVAALARERHGRIDIWFSNAGFAGTRDGAVLQANEVWQKSWELHVMSHVYAAREVLPEMLARGEGYLLQTASSVALTMQVEKAHYSVTKHAALSLSEWLAANYRPSGVRVSCFCPGAMDTPMLRANGMPVDHPAIRNALKPDHVAELLVRGIAAEKFLIDNNGPVDGAAELAPKIAAYDDWLGAMKP